VTGIRALVAALLVAALAAPVGAAADPLDAAQVLEVTGSGPATATFTLDAPMTFDLDRAVVLGTGRYAGVELYSASGRSYGGVLSMPGMDSPSAPMPVPHTWKLGAAVVTLTPGRYRVYLLTDAFADVRLPLSKGGSMTVTATTPNRQAYDSAYLDLPAGPSTAALTRTVTTRARTRTYVFGQFGRGVATADVEIRACLAKVRKACKGVQTIGSHATSTTAGTLRIGLGQPAWRDRAPRDARVEVSAAASYATTLSLGVVQFDLA
jgi:hypothetical protein